MDARVHSLGERTARTPPAWAIRHLGPVPDDPARRDDWVRRARTVASYREQYGHESDTDALGPAPARGHAEAFASWQQAYTALGRPVDERDVAAASDHELRGHLERYQREEAWAPPYVADELRQAHLTARDRQVRLEKARARQAVADEQQAASREQLAAIAAGHEQLVAASRRQVDELEEVHTARTAWHAHTEPARQAAQAARAELEQRHPPEDDERTRQDSRETVRAPETTQVQPERREVHTRAEQVVGPEKTHADRADSSRERKTPDPAADTHKQQEEVQEPARTRVPRQEALERAREATRILAERRIEAERRERADLARRGDDWARQQQIEGPSRERGGPEL